MYRDPLLRVVCIREIQKSLTFSAKSLLERKIRQFGLQREFVVLTNLIRRRGGEGVCIFQGMQEHNADSVKSLDSFHVAWVEEAQNFSQRSLELLRPTIREEGSELWFSWNPHQPEDAIDNFLVKNQPDDATVVHVNFYENPFCPSTAKKEARDHRKIDPDTYPWVWLGEYHTLSEAQVLAGKWRVDEFDVPTELGADADGNPIEVPLWDGPYYGSDFGDANPTTLVRCWVDRDSRRLFIEYESGAPRVPLEAYGKLYDRIPGARDHTIRCDAARPDLIGYLRRQGFQTTPGMKWPGSVEDGIAYLRSFSEIVIHERCRKTAEEARLWRYKTNRAGDILPVLADAWNHYWDAIRYALAPLIREREPLLL